MSAPAKVELSLGRLKFRFASASELRDSLLKAFVDASYAGGPFVMVDPEHAEPAWGWVADLVRQRLDWWECAGVALQHAANEGGDLAKVALADLMANFLDSVVLLPWVEPLEKRWPDVHATKNNCGWDKGQVKPTLSEIVAAQKSHVASAGKPDTRVILWQFKSGGKPDYADLRDPSDLESLLQLTAQAGRFPDLGGPWSWLHDEVRYRRSWLPDALPVTAEKLVGDETIVRALLDWLFDGWDVWRFAPLLERWASRPPSWWSYAAKKKPSGWQRPMRPASYRSDARTVGDVAMRMLTKARHQLATPPVLDLPPLP